MALETDPDSYINQEKTIRWAFRIRPGFSPRKLQRAFDQLVARHDSLRLRFIKSGDAWLAEILDQHAQGLLVEDLTHLSASDQDAVIAARSKEPMTALSPALFEMHLLRCGPAGDVVLTRLSHAVGDGYSAAVLIEDLLKFLTMMPPKSKALGHADFMRYRQLGLEQQAEAKEAFWLDTLMPLPDEVQIGRCLKGLEKHSFRTVGQTLRLDAVLPAALSAKLADLAKTTGVSAYCYLHAAYCQAICTIAGAPEMVVKSPLSRHNTATAEFIGADVQAVVVKYTSNTEDLTARAARVAAQLAEGAAHLPTVAFRKGRAIDRAVEDSGLSFSRFLVHVEMPTGRLKASPFKKLFDKGLHEKVTLGPVSMERMHLPADVETNYELVLLLDQTRMTPTVSLIANAQGYDLKDLEAIAQGIQAQIQGCHGLV